ncbi:MAG: (d)CMP kinase [Planctomycetota bacterium]|nr:(d)CMP kinase [Planctomycetota bacterium]
MIITLDGPAGSGKSTVARKIAARLQIAYLDTGAMYRAVAWKCLQEDVDLADHDGIIEIVRESRISLDCGPTHTRVTMDGQDVSEAIRSMDTNQATSFIAREPEVRRVLVEQQRCIGAELGSLVSEGRDQGSVVFPQADAKFVLDAAIEKRAERRFHEMCADGIDLTYEQVLENLRLRDGNDQCQWAPLLEPGCAIIVDTSKMQLDEVVEVLLEHVKQACNH